jgi:hypothetical protein
MDPPGAATPGADPSGTVHPADRPSEQRRAIEIEGMPEEIRVALYRTPADFPIPFSTYVPAEMIAETVSSGEGDGVHFVANFGGHRNDAAAVRLVAAREGATEDEVVATLHALAAGLGTQLVEERESRFAWSIRELRNVAPASQSAAAAEGLMALGRRGDRLFVLAMHHPAEYGDGFGPRAGVILDEWRWSDTGEPLARRR